VQSAGKCDFRGIILLKKNLWTKSTDRWTAPARSTVTGGHCRARELSGARPPAALVPKSYDQGAGEGKDGHASSMTLGRKLKKNLF
jgi:hypothetical protein